MGKWTFNAIPTEGLKTMNGGPIDDRFVVRTVNDLFNIDTWVLSSKANPRPLIYPGICVSVVNDPTSANNGLYMLMDNTKYTMQSWDSAADNYHADGWRRIDGASVGGAIMDDDQFDGNGTAATPYYVSDIDGGEIERQSNQ